MKPAQIEIKLIIELRGFPKPQVTFNDMMAVEEAGIRLGEEIPPILATIKKSMEQAKKNTAAAMANAAEDAQIAKEREMGLTVKQVAARLNISVQKVWKMVYSREIAHVKVGRSVRITGQEVDLFVAKNTVARKRT